MKKTALIFLIVTTLACPCFASRQIGGVDYDEVYVDYSKLNKDEVTSEAELFFENATRASDVKEKDKFYDLAMRKYQILTKKDTSNPYIYTQLGRVYDYKEENKLAIKYFSMAMNISPTNPHTNYYFGDYFYKRRSYLNALKLYNRASNYGYQKDYQLNYNLGTIYEKLADLIKAKEHYQASLNLDPENEELINKIEQINALGYENSQYYHFIRTNE